MTVTGFIYDVFLFIALVALLMIITEIYLGYSNSSSISSTFYNTLHCGLKKCPLPNSIKPIKFVDTNTLTNFKYNFDTALTTAGLIRNVYTESSDKSVAPSIIKSNTVSIPNIKFVSKLFDDPKLPIFGSIYTSQNNKILFIIYRGTTQIEEWYQNLTYKQVPFPGFNSDKNVSVHEGFLEAYTNTSQAIKKYLIGNGNKWVYDHIIVAGHSLGAATAAICAADLLLNSTKDIIGNTKLSCYIFACPRLGNLNLQEVVKTNNIPIYRIENIPDLIPVMPPSVVPNFSDENTPYMYAHIGEVVMRFDSNNESLGENHSINTYLEFLATQK